VIYIPALHDIRISSVSCVCNRYMTVTTLQKCTVHTVGTVIYTVYDSYDTKEWIELKQIKKCGLYSIQSPVYLIVSTDGWQLVLLISGRQPHPLLGFLLFLILHSGLFTILFIVYNQCDRDEEGQNAEWKFSYI